MGKLHELLAVEKTLNSGTQKLLADAESKFGKDHFFKGHDKSLSMIKDGPEKAHLEAAAREVKPLVTNVQDTLDYVFRSWIRTEDALLQKNSTNQLAKADIMFEGKLVVAGVPVDELMGLESRLETIRRLIEKAPTLDLSREWEKDATQGKNVWRTKLPEVTTKTEKVVTPIVLYDATDKHPAQIKESSKDEVIGTVRTQHFSGAITSAQKAEMMTRIDDLISEIKKSRQRANSIEAVDAHIGQALIDIIMEPLK